MRVRCLEDLTALEGARVLLRIDLERFGEISAPVDDPRFLGTFTTVDWLLERGARIVMCAAQEDLPGPSMAGFSNPLASVLGRAVEVLPVGVGEPVAAALAEQPPDRLLLLGNLAAEPGGAGGHAAFSDRLAVLFSHYVDDAFAAAHLESELVKEVATRFPDGRRAIGRAMQTEVDALACLMNRPDRPNVAVLGGRVTARRLAAARALTARTDRFGAVGELGLALAAARGTSQVCGADHPDLEASVVRLLQLARELDVELVLPSDVRVGRARRAVAVDRLTSSSRPVDVGPATLEAVRSLFHDAETAFWCGTTTIGDDLGASRGGDKALARALGSVPGFSVVAGLETADRVGGFRRLGGVSHVVSGCEAALAFIAGERLPGLAIMED